MKTNLFLHSTRFSSKFTLPLVYKGVWSHLLDSFYSMVLFWISVVKFQLRCVNDCEMFRSWMVVH